MRGGEGSRYAGGKREVDMRVGGGWVEKLVDRKQPYNVFYCNCKFALFMKLFISHFSK